MMVEPWASVQVGMFQRGWDHSDVPSRSFARTVALQTGSDERSSVERARGWLIWDEIVQDKLVRKGVAGGPRFDRTVQLAPDCAKSGVVSAAAW